MNSDLDFAQPELEARGVHLECYRWQNPLLIRPSQKLGRVLAAQAIIAEMVELASSNSGRTVYKPVDHGFEKRGDGTCSQGSQQPEDATAGPDEAESYCTKNDSSTSTPTMRVAQQEEPSADALIIQSDQDEDAQESGFGRDESPPTDHEQESPYQSEEDDDPSKSPYRQGLDTSSAEELVHILDESLSDLAPSALQRTYIAASSGELEQLTELTARTNEPGAPTARDEERSASEYGDVFEDEAGGIVVGDDDAGDNVGGDNVGDEDEAGSDDAGDSVDGNDEAGSDDADNDDIERSTENQSNHETADDRSVALTGRGDREEVTSEPSEKQVLLPEHDGLRESDAQDDAPTSLDEEDNQNAETDESDHVAAEADITSPHPPHNSELESPSHQLLADMGRLSREAGFDVPETAVCLAWTNEKLMMSALQNHDPLVEALEGSFYAALAAFQLSPTLKVTAELLLTNAAKTTRLARRLWQECVSIADSVYGHLASKIELALESGNSLVSEIDIGEALELTEGVLVDVDSSSWSHLRTGIEFLQLIRSLGESVDKTNSARTSTGVSRLVKVFYPYLVNLPREKLPVSWRRVARVFATTSPDLDDLVFLMDPTCKTLLFAAIGGGSERGIDESADDAAAFPKLTIVCERGNVLESSAAVVWLKVFETKSVQRSQFVLYPFFRSSFGEKVVDGVRVEEGEGKGPLKEWIALVSSEMAAKWADVALDASFVADKSADASDNKLVAPRLARHISAGYEVSWQSNGEQREVRVVNKVVDDDTVLMDRVVASRQSFPVSELNVRRPRTCYLQHIRASESLWLNAQTVDGSESRRVLRFYGWYLAMAVAHSTAIDIPLHRLFFRLLFDETHRVSLEDVRSLDSTLHESLVAMKSMSPTDFQAFLELEDADASLTVDEYIERAVAEQFGAESNIGWQFRELRAGFQSVFSLAELSAASIDPDDLASVVCGNAASATTRDADFSVDEIFRVALDPDFVKCVPLRRVFWRVVNAFDPLLKRKFVKFVTGVETLPLPGTEFMRIEMPFAALTAAENEKILLMLPQSHVSELPSVSSSCICSRGCMLGVCVRGNNSHARLFACQTCDNTLELPNYWQALCWKARHQEEEESESLEAELAALLGKKLREAVEYSNGYGLDGTSAISGILSARRRPTSSASMNGADTGRAPANDDSYESLDLPAMGDLSNSAGEIARAKTPSLQQTVMTADKVPASASREEKRAAEAVEPPELAKDESRPEESGDAVPEFSTPREKESARRNGAEESYGDDDWDES
ncbi:hypothetical protein PybrP1_008168 [[Pythium] brassicae (nom. inval.)]|nr:hypothetical protein PybrP1_008168 [[Pythium] brassicae (nom. inval.)]